MKYWVLLLFSCWALSCNSDLKWEGKQAPATFTARFETTKGAFIAEFDRSLSPAGVDRVYQLIQAGFYEDIYVYRVVPGFVVQFGIHNDSTRNQFWESRTLPDEPVIGANQKGTIAFARGGPETRSTQLFINLSDNLQLDQMPVGGVTGYPPIGTVTDGMEVIMRFNGEYRERPGRQQDSIHAHGNEWLEQNFPGLDYIIKADVIELK